MSNCDMCGKPAPNYGGDHTPDEVIQPDGGIHLSIFGGYAMFTDPFFDRELRNRMENVRLCHDCSVKVVELFPQEFQELFKGGHSPGSGKTDPCCKFCWTIGPNNETLLAWPDSKWVPNG